MHELDLGLAALLMVSLILGGVRIARGPTRADRMLAMQFLTTSAVAIFLLLADALDEPALRNLSLAFVTLAALTTIAFTQAYSARRRPRS